jgi:HPt (histidine-containing phosphotransfer) domain-containing protein
MMPEMDGIEAVKIIREKGYTYPIVALTANAVSGQAEVFMANGFDGFISKPIDIRDLNATLNKWVRDRQPPDVVESARAAYGGGAAVVSAIPQVDAELVRIFTRDAEKAFAVLQGYEERNAYGSDNLQMYIIHVHALKSALANIGEINLACFAGELEQAGREWKVTFIADRTSSFLTELRAALLRLKSGANEYGADDGTDISDDDIAYARSLLLDVKKFCAVYDKKAAKSALKEAKHRPLPPAYGKYIDIIAEHLLHSDFEKAQEVCSVCLSDEHAVKSGV